MNDEQSNSQPQRELVWLAQYYYAHGFKDKAREIMDGLKESSNVIDLFAIDEERRA